jgi:hypothetical protein
MMELSLCIFKMVKSKHDICWVEAKVTVLGPEAWTLDSGSKYKYLL